MLVTETVPTLELGRLLASRTSNGAATVTANSGNSDYIGYSGFFDCFLNMFGVGLGNYEFAPFEELEIGAEIG